MSSISSMARFRNPTKSARDPGFSSTLKRTSSLGSLNKRSSANLAPSFNASKTSPGLSEEYSNLEAEYIKNLQQQIYFLELEANFLRDQARKATHLQPKMTEEAGRMLDTLKDLQSTVDGLHLDIKRKESNLDMVNSEKERLDGRLKLLQDTHNREKKLLVEEIVQLKKQNEMTLREIAQKEEQIFDARKELDKGSTSLTSAEQKIRILTAQVDQKSDELRHTQLALEDKRAELLKVQTQLQELEDRYYSSTASIQDKAVEEFRNEIRVMQHKMKETELNAQQDRYLKNKMSDDIANLVKENALLGTQVVELQKQLDRERSLRESRDTRHASNITELVTVRDKEKQLKYELDKAREELKYERDRVQHLMNQLAKQEQEHVTSNLSQNTLRSRLAELEGRLSGVEVENTQLRRDKMLLVDHVSELQKQVAERDQEATRMQNHMHTMEGTLAGLERRNKQESSLQSQRWGEFEKMAESMKNLSKSMTARSLTPEY
ncbi:paramyosin-like [Acanthaster planci]|uniref:Paramyosin-like n=1 Tax=Acanthaster planci TaxID=133434 RepID=A0A8B7YD20_ACAPL|nr:paramyosin-like [Acanthaster planci]